MGPAQDICILAFIDTFDWLLFFYVYGYFYLFQLELNIYNFCYTFPSLECLIWASVLLHVYLGSSPSCLLTRRPYNPQKKKLKVSPTSWTKIILNPNAFRRFCICSRWATQRKTQESVLCVLAILEIRSSKQRMKMFVYGLSQCSDVCFRSQGCGVVHVYLLGPFSHDSPEPWKNQRAVQDSTSCREEIFWEETLISHGLGFPSCTQCCLSVRGRRERETLRQTDTKERTIKAKEHERSIWSAHVHAVILHPLIIAAHGRH